MCEATRQILEGLAEADEKAAQVAGGPGMGEIAALAAVVTESLS